MTLKKWKRNTKDEEAAIFPFQFIQWQLFRGLEHWLREGNKLSVYVWPDTKPTWLLVQSLTWTSWLKSSWCMLCFYLGGMWLLWRGVPLIVQGVKIDLQKGFSVQQTWHEHKNQDNFGGLRFVRDMIWIRSTNTGKVKRLLKAHWWSVSENSTWWKDFEDIWLFNNKVPMPIWDKR